MPSRVRAFTVGEGFDTLILGRDPVPAPHAMIKAASVQATVGYHDFADSLAPRWVRIGQGNVASEPWDEGDGCCMTTSSASTMTLSMSEPGAVSELLRPMVPRHPLPATPLDVPTVTPLPPRIAGGSHGAGRCVRGQEMP